MSENMEEVVTIDVTPAMYKAAREAVSLSEIHRETFYPDGNVVSMVTSHPVQSHSTQRPSAQGNGGNEGGDESISAATSRKRALASSAAESSVAKRRKQFVNGSLVAEQSQEARIEAILSTYALVLLEKDEKNGVSWLGCRLCAEFGSNKRWENYVRIWDYPCSEQSIINHALSHGEDWERYNTEGDSIFKQEDNPKAECYVRNMNHLKTVRKREAMAKAKKTAKEKAAKGKAAKEKAAKEKAAKEKSGKKRRRRRKGDSDDGGDDVVEVRRELGTLMEDTLEDAL